MKRDGPPRLALPRLRGTPRRICRGLIEAFSCCTLRRLSMASLPGESAGASLKRPAVRRAGGPASSPLPGESAGASLKHHSLQQSPRCHVSTPRRICRGLIEASVVGPNSPANCFTPRRICRGLIEAAPKAGPGIAPSSTTPRRICRGLIEARPRSTECSRTGSALPGESAGASLKPVLFSAVKYLARYTPRRICRGLIEASKKVRTRLVRCLPLPGESAGASLKLASPPAAHTASIRVHSPANLPGPH